MYQKIASHSTVRELWANTLVERGVVSEAKVEAINKQHYGELQGALDALQPEQDFVEPQPEPPPPGAASRAETGVPLDQLQALNRSLGRVDELVSEGPGSGHRINHLWSERSGRGEGRALQLGCRHWV